MTELLLVVTIAGERVALFAHAVESVVELDTLILVPRAAPHVAGLSALRSRVLTVIDCMRSAGTGRDRLLGRHPGSAVSSSTDIITRSSSMVVEDVVEASSDPSPVRAAMGPGWERVALGMVEDRKRPATAGRRRRAHFRR